MDTTNDILFIIDAQNDFCTAGGSLLCENADAAVRSICKLLGNNMFNQVICTLDYHYEDDYAYTKEYRHLPVLHCIKSTFGINMNKDIYDALYNPEWQSFIKDSFMLDIDDVNDLLDEVKNYMPDRIFVCGFATDICVLNNALLLNKIFKDTDIYVVQDCCAGTSAEMHDCALKILVKNGIQVINSFDINNIL